MVEILHRRGIQIEASSDGLDIVVDYWLGWPMFAFFVAWTSPSIYGVSHYLADGGRGSIPYLESAFSVLGIGITLWSAFGREIMVFRPQSIMVFRGMFGI